MHKPMVLFALLGISSRHLAILTQQPEPAEASFYHGQCLRLVIEQLAQPGSIHDDNLLATVVCLRIYEEIEHKITGIVWRTEPVQGVKSPVATFVFHYRSKGTICTVLTNRGCTLTDCNQLLLRTF